MRDIKFICQTCEYYNSKETGVDGYEQRQTEFHTLTDACKHLIETGRPYVESTHDMVAVIEENE